MKYYTIIKRSMIKEEALKVDGFYVTDFNSSGKTKVLREWYKNDDDWCKIYENNYIRSIYDEAIGFHTDGVNKFVYTRANNGSSTVSTIEITEDEIKFY